ncbi:hypothetical protein QUF72_21915 [Desulfobacterales bacterium HSG2]|nr:hypothetical protein [Desulfobacterales bacterium HSG2]
MEKDKTIGISYYKGKFLRRLYRQIIGFEVLKKSYSEEISLFSSNTASLLSLDESITNGMAVKDHIEKACIVGLKTEFELFFSIYCRFVIRHLLFIAEKSGNLPKNHEGLRDCIQDKKKFFYDFAQLGFTGAQELFIQKAIPDYGLERMIRMLDQCGWRIFNFFTDADISDFLNKLPCELCHTNLHPIHQIITAFQVRHTIEHCFSKVTSSFREKVFCYLPRSSWIRHFPDLIADGTRITIDETDIKLTAASMSFVSHVIVSQLEGCIQSCK